MEVFKVFFLDRVLQRLAEQIIGTWVVTEVCLVPRTEFNSEVEQIIAILSTESKQATKQTRQRDNETRTRSWSTSGDAARTVSSEEGNGSNRVHNKRKADGEHPDGPADGVFHKDCGHDHRTTGSTDIQREEACGGGGFGAEGRDRVDRNAQLVPIRMALRCGKLQRKIRY